MDALTVGRVLIPASDLSWKAVRASGPGGQNVNKVSSKVELRFDLPGTRALDPLVKQRLRAQAASRLDADGRLVIVSQEHRDQLRNLETARDKLAALIAGALVAPTPRRPTRPSRASRERRLTAKTQRGQQKRDRRSSDD